MSTGTAGDHAESWRRISHGEQLARTARRYPDRKALHIGSGRRTYAELDRRVTLLTDALRRLGVRPGDRVAMLLRNRVEFVETLYACARLGAIAVPVNFRLVAAEVAYLLEDSGAAVLIVENELWDVGRAAIRELRCIPVVIANDDGLPADVIDYEEIIRCASADPVPVDAAESDPMCILYTSGTTGAPKGAVLDHLGMTLQSLARIQVQGLSPGTESWLTGLQLFHVGGLCALLPSIMLGATFLALAPGQTSAGLIAELLEQEHVTTCSLIPTQWQQLCALSGIDRRAFALRRISWGTAPATPALLRRLDEVFGHLDIFNIFGQTETSGMVCTLAGDEARANRGSVGRPVLNVEMRVVDEFVEDLPVGHVGEIVYRGPTVMLGYWNKPEATAEAFVGGWFHSGDLGRLDAQALLWIVDRKKDMIISGGENIYPAEVERVILTHPQVAEVAVIGVPHERWGETPLAVVVPSDPACPPAQAEIIDHCRKHLASYKKPTAVVLAGALPRNANGKVQKFKIRECYRPKGEVHAGNR